MAALEEMAGVAITNWASTHTARPRSYYEPGTVAEVRQLVRQARESGRIIRAVGGAHSPNDCAMNADIMISLRKLNRLLAVDSASRTIQVEAGVTLRELNDILPEHGLALSNLGSISDQSVAGMLSTGTHGTGGRFGLLATFILELQLVLADGSVAVCNRRVEPSLFAAALCGLGALGIVTGAVIQCVPAFDLHVTETPDTLPAVLADLPRRIPSAPYYRFWWFPHTDRVMEWRARPTPPATASAAAAVTTRSRSGGLLGWIKGAASWLLDMGIGFHVLQAALYVGRWVKPLVPLVNSLWFRMLFNVRKERQDRSDRVFNINCLFQQHVDEWAIPVDQVPAALSALKDMLAATGHKAHYPIEVRFTAGDDIWLSPAYKRPTAFIGIIMYKPFGAEVEYQQYFLKYEEVSDVTDGNRCPPVSPPRLHPCAIAHSCALRSFLQIMASLGGRPHWAKDFGYRGDTDFGRVYPRWGEFKALRQRLDPTGVFVNPWLRRTLGLPGADQTASLLSVQPPVVAEPSDSSIVDCMGVVARCEAVSSLYAPAPGHSGSGSGSNNDGPHTGAGALPVPPPAEVLPATPFSFLKSTTTATSSTTA